VSSVPTSVSDLLSNWNDQFATAARILGRSKHRQAIFRTVYQGKKQIKTVAEIMVKTGLSQTHVLKEGGIMAGLLMEKVPGGYKKKSEFATRYRSILNLAGDRKRLERLPTKTSPKSSATVTAAFPALAQKARFISVDDLGSFSRIRGKVESSKSMKLLPEKKLKSAFQKIIGENGSFKDWGGEKSDLFTTRLLLGTRKVRAAIAFKGKATKGKLVPAKMGKNGDQINRLFDEPAEVFLVVYPGQIDSAIISQMQAFAIGNALKGNRIFYGVVDGADISRLAEAYPNEFS
jgi:hypothetical protein